MSTETVPVSYDRAISTLRQCEEWAVADWLEFIRNTSEPKQLRLRIAELERYADGLRERLDKYEPRKSIDTARCYRAGPMSDG